MLLYKYTCVVCKQKDGEQRYKTIDERFTVQMHPIQIVVAPYYLP